MIMYKHTMTDVW